MYYAGQPVSGVISGEQVAVTKPIWQVESQQQRLGVSHAHCRRSYRVYEPYESGIMQGYGSIGWYTRTDGEGVVTPDDGRPETNEESADVMEAEIFSVMPSACYPQSVITGAPTSSQTTHGAVPGDLSYTGTGSENCYGPTLKWQRSQDGGGSWVAEEEDWEDENGICEPTDNPAYNPDLSEADCLSQAKCWQRQQPLGTPNVQGTWRQLPSCPVEEPEVNTVAPGQVPTTTNLVRARRWCVRSTNYANRNIRFRYLWESAYNSDLVRNNAYVAWRSLSGGTRTDRVGSGERVTCYAGRHAIGDSTGKGWYDPDVDLPNNPVSHFEFAGNTPEYFVQHATGNERGTSTSDRRTALGQVRYVGRNGVTIVGTNVFATHQGCPDGICSNLLGAEQSRMRLVSHFINDDGELEEINGDPRRRTVHEEIRNYMNWYSYYRYRTLLAKSGMSLAFANVIDPNNTTLPNKAMNGKYIRLGYDTINSNSLETCNHNLGGAQGGSSPCGPGQSNSGVGSSNDPGKGVVPFRDFGNEPNRPDGTSHPYNTKKFVKEFYDWVNGLTENGATPLNAAINSVGQYYMTPAPWKEFPPASYVANSRDPGNGGVGAIHACRRSFLILMTDGYYNDGRSLAPVNALNRGNVDCATSAQWPSITAGNKSSSEILFAQSPFCGEFKRGNTTYRVRNSLADKAMFYWGTNLLYNRLPGLVPKVTPTKKDPAFWPHMQTFTIGLGVQGRLSDAEVNNFLAHPEDVRTKVPLWTNPTGLDTEYEKIDDLMHAGLTGHGGTIAASDAQEFASKLTALLTEIGGEDGTNTGYAGGGRRNEANTIYKADYNGLNWSGSLKGYDTTTCKDANGRLNIAEIQAGRCKVGALKDEPEWVAEKLLSAKLTYLSGSTNPNAVGNRMVFTTLNGVAIPFDATSNGLVDALDVTVGTVGGGRDKCPIPRSDTTCLVNNGSGQPRVNATNGLGRTFLINYLRGSQQNEDSSTDVAYVGATYYGFRNRSKNFLGDIVNSTPYVQGNFSHNNYGYGSYSCAQGIAIEGGSCPAGTKNAFFPANDVISYRTRAATKMARGMVDASVGDADERARRKAIKLQDTTVYVGANDGMLHAFDGLDGEELFAYVPEGVHKRLKYLADPEYNQKHKYYVDGSPFVRDILLEGKWQAVLVGHTGRGGKSFFALNVERPKDFTEDDVLWEIVGADADYPNGNPNLGNPVDGEGVITPVHGLMRKWGVIFGNGYNSRNGDACLFVVGLEKNPEIKTMCVGVTSGAQGKTNGLGVPTWYDHNNDALADVAYAGDALGNFWKFNLRDLNSTPLLLLKATDKATSEPQPIVARAQGFFVRDEDGNPTRQLVFGTGKYFEQADLESKVIQSIYGIRDNDPLGNGNPLLTRDDLLPRKYVPMQPENDRFCRDTQGGNPILCDNFSAWRLASHPNAETGVYRNDAYPEYTTGGTMGYVIDFDAPHMQSWLVTASGTQLTATNFVVPTALTQDDPCASGKEGGLVEINPFSGGWVSSVMFPYIENLSNLFTYPGSYGAEINRDNKNQTSGIMVEVEDPLNPGNKIMVMMNQIDNAQGGDADPDIPPPECLTTLNVPGADSINLGGESKKCGGRSGRQSWRQLR
jgi:Tfp pilus tip-associated adhesin PilY1